MENTLFLENSAVRFVSSSLTLATKVEESCGNKIALIIIASANWFMRDKVHKSSTRAWIGRRRRIWKALSENPKYQATEVTMGTPPLKSLWRNGSRTSLKTRRRNKRVSSSLTEDTIVNVVKRYTHCSQKTAPQAYKFESCH